VGGRQHLCGASSGDEQHAVIVADDDVLGRHLVRAKRALVNASGSGSSNRTGPGG
jgi:hypothetical protein